MSYKSGSRARSSSIARMPAIPLPTRTSFLRLAGPPTRRGRRGSFPRDAKTPSLGLDGAHPCAPTPSGTTLCVRASTAPRVISVSLGWSIAVPSLEGVIDGEPELVGLGVQAVGAVVGVLESQRHALGFRDELQV